MNRSRGRILYALLVWAALQGYPVQVGMAPHYAPGVMERVARVRGMERVGCMVASPTEAIGAWVWVYGRRTGALRYCRVTDVSQARDRARHIRTGRIVELDHESARVICGSMRDRPEACPVVVVRV